MRRVLPVRILAIGFLGWLLAAAGADAQTLRVGGTGSALGLLQRLGGEFSAASELRIDIVPSLGSGGAIRALGDGKLELAVSARPLTSEEAARGLDQVLVLKTAFVFATSHRNPNGFKSDDLAKIFADDQPTWADGSPLRLILRPRSETDTALLGELFPGMAGAIETLRRHPEVPTAATDQDNVVLSERMPGSLIGTSATQLATERPSLRWIELDGVAPVLANFESGAYRFTKRLYVLTRSNGSPDVQRFVDFLRSPQGVKALRAAETLLDGE